MKLTCQFRRFLARTFRPVMVGEVGPYPHVRRGRNHAIGGSFPKETIMFVAIFHKETSHGPGRRIPAPPTNVRWHQVFSEAPGGPARAHVARAGPPKTRERSNVGHARTEGTPKVRERSNLGITQIEGTPSFRERSKGGNAQIEGTLELRERSVRGNAQLEGTLSLRERPNQGNAQFEGTLSLRERSN